MLRYESLEGYMNKDLKWLVERARQVEVTTEQAQEQRRSFVYGNTHIENDRITRELVEQVDNALKNDSDG